MTEFKVGDRVIVKAETAFDGLEALVTETPTEHGPISVPSGYVLLYPLSARPDGGQTPFMWKTVNLDKVESDGGTYVLDYDGLNALGVGAKVETMYGTIVERVEGGWSYDGSEPDKVTDLLTPAFSGPYLVLNEGAPVEPDPIDGGTYVLDAGGLDALGVGARIEESAGTVTAIRKESGWESAWWTGILNSEDVSRYFSLLSFRVLDEGAPLEKPKPVETVVPKGTILRAEKDRPVCMAGVLKGDLLRSEGNNRTSVLTGTVAGVVYYTNNFERLAEDGFSVVDESALIETYAPGTVLVVQSDGSLKVVHTPS